MTHGFGGGGFHHHGGGGFHHHHHHHRPGAGMAFAEGAMIGAAIGASSTAYRPGTTEIVSYSAAPSYSNPAYTVRTVTRVKTRKCGLWWFLVGLIVLTVLAAAIPKPSSIDQYLEEPFEILVHCESPVLVSSFDISVDAGVAVYAAPNTPKPDSRMNVSISKSLSTPPDDFEYWGYNLLAGSTATVQWKTPMFNRVYVVEGLSQCSDFSYYSGYTVKQSGYHGTFQYTVKNNGLVCFIFDNNDYYSYSYGRATFNISAIVYNVNSTDETRVIGCASSNGCRMTLEPGETSCAVFVPFFSPQSRSELNVDLNSNGRGAFWGGLFGGLSLVFFIIMVSCCVCDSRVNKERRMNAAVQAQMTQATRPSQIPTAPVVAEDAPLLAQKGAP